MKRLLLRKTFEHSATTLIPTPSPLEGEGRSCRLLAGNQGVGRQMGAGFQELHAHHAPVFGVIEDHTRGNLLALAADSRR